MSGEDRYRKFEDRLVNWDQAEAAFPGCSAEWDANGDPLAPNLVLYESTSGNVLWLISDPTMRTVQGGAHPAFNELLGKRWFFRNSDHGWTSYSGAPLERIIKIPEPSVGIAPRFFSATQLVLRK
jgi:hypothetical protein